MTSANLKERDYIKVWAIFFVIAFVGGTVAGAIVGGIAGGILGALGGPARVISLVSGTLGFLVTLPISYFSFRFAVTKFLLPTITTPEAAVVPLKAAA
jgi:hypothetical protein